MSNPFVIPLGLAFIAGSVALLVDLVRRIVNFSSDQERAMAEKGIPREEARRDAVLLITCGTIVLLALLNLSVTYVKAFRYHLERPSRSETSALHGACAEDVNCAAPSASSGRLTSSEPHGGHTRQRFPKAREVRHLAAHAQT